MKISQLFLSAVLFLTSDFALAGKTPPGGKTTFTRKKTNDVGSSSSFSDDEGGGMFGMDDVGDTKGRAIKKSSPKDLSRSSDGEGDGMFGMDDVGDTKSSALPKDSSKSKDSKSKREKKKHVRQQGVFDMDWFEGQSSSSSDDEGGDGQGELDGGDSLDRSDRDNEFYDEGPGIKGKGVESFFDEGKPKSVGAGSSSLPIQVGSRLRSSFNGRLELVDDVAQTYVPGSSFVAPHVLAEHERAKDGFVGSPDVHQHFNSQGTYVPPSPLSKRREGDQRRLRSVSEVGKGSGHKGHRSSPKTVDFVIGAPAPRSGEPGDDNPQEGWLIEGLAAALASTLSANQLGDGQQPWMTPSNLPIPGSGSLPGGFGGLGGGTREWHVPGAHSSSYPNVGFLPPPPPGK